jgi:4-diphosphocytidyl-2-C-methyl-D-erythritol kinase
VRRASASAKLNLALVVGPRRDDGYHEVATVLQRIDLADRVELEESDALSVTGFPVDTIVTRALRALADAEGREPRWRVRLEKRIPVAAGLGGGSSDAATALALANGSLSDGELHDVAATVGSDVPFFLTSGPQLATGRGTELERLELPQDYWIVLVLPNGATKSSTADVYARFDEADGFAERRADLIDTLDEVERATDLARLPPNDLASSPLAPELRELGAFRADVTGAGPAVYGLFVHERQARAAADALRPRGRVWITTPAWYG